MEARYHKKYAQKELERVLKYVNSGIPLEKASLELGRTPYGLAYKLFYLSKENPKLYNPSKIRDYVKAELRKHKGDFKGQNRRYRERYRKTHPYIRLKNKIDADKFRKYLTRILENYKKQSDFAREMNVSESLISYYLSLEREPSFDFLKKMAMKVEIPYDKFISKFS